jgi:hypothetical protein
MSMGGKVNNKHRTQISKKLRADGMWGNTCYHSVQRLLPSHLLSKTKLKKQILFVTLYGCETWSLTLREEQGLSVFENRVLRRILYVTEE